MAKLKILLIDDEADFSELLAANLMDSGFEVMQVNDPAKTVAVARDFRPDVCLIDLVMPNMDGGDVITALKRDSVLSKTPILMLTALIEENPDCPGEIQMRGGLPFLSKTSDLGAIINGITTQNRYNEVQCTCHPIFMDRSQLFSERINPRSAHSMSCPRQPAPAYPALSSQDGFVTHEKRDSLDDVVTICLTERNSSL